MEPAWVYDFSGVMIKDRSIQDQVQCSLTTIVVQWHEVRNKTTNII